MAKRSSPMDVNQFAEYVHKLHERTEKFVDQRPGAPLSDALEELMYALEGLRVAEEELRTQNKSIRESSELVNAARQRYLDLFEFSPDAYIVTDEHGTINDVNQTAIQMFYLSRQNLVGKPLVMFVSDEDKNRFHLLIGDLVWPHQGSYQDEFHFQSPQRSPIIVSLAVARFIDHPENRSPVTTLRWSLRNITEQRRLELEEREQLFRSMFEQAGVGMAHINEHYETMMVNQRLCEMLGYSSDELRELSLWDITCPDDRQISIDAHRELFEGKTKQAVLEKRYINKQGSVIWCRLAISHIVPPGGRPAYNLTVVEDITERKALEAAEREQRALSKALYEIATVLHTTLNLPEVLEHILEQVERVVPYDSANVMLVDAAGVRMVRRRQTISTGEGNESHAVEDAPNLRAMQTTGEPFIIADIQGDPQWENLCCAAWARSYVGVPIQSQNQIVGFLNLTSAKPNFFTLNHAQRLSMFAPQAAIAIRNAQLHQKAQELAVLEERQRLARDLHDAVTQTLFSATILVDTLPRVWEKDVDRVPKLLQQLGTLNRGALSEMRILLGELRPTQLVNMKLKDLLLHVVQAAQGRTKATITLTVKDDIPIPPDVKIAVYRIAQEALNNVIKHARATEVYVSYTSQASGMELVVSDNGRGFDLGTTKAGLGLGSMPERASGANAHFEIQSVINQGTRVRVRWRAADDPLS